MALASMGQSDWSGGIYRGRQAPANSVYDAVDALVNDEGHLYKRGGSTYHSNADTAQNLVGIFDGYLGAGLRTLTWPSAATGVYYLSSDDATPGGTMATASKVNTFARGAVIAGAVWLPCSDNSDGLFAWGGARKASATATAPTINVTSGSATITASGTTWAADYEAGSLVIPSTAGVTTGFYIVQAVNSNTSITLTAPYAGATGTTTAVIENFSQVIGPSTIGNVTPRFVTAAGASPRLWVASANRAYYSDRNQPAMGFTNNYIELPAPSQIIGADSFGDSVVLFTTDGVWMIANTELDPVDDYGNQQWQQLRISRETILWGDPGIAAWQNALIVPGVDDVLLFTASGALEAITGARGDKHDGGIRSLYRGYVASGYSPGTATVFRSHYLLPIMNGTTLIDVLACRLDHGFAWTRLSGGAAGGAYSRRAGSTARTPKLLGLTAKRITNLTGTFAPTTSNSQDADATNVTATITTRDYVTQDDMVPAITRRARLGFELTSDGTHTAPTVSLAYSSDQDADSYTTLTDKGTVGSTGTGGTTSDGSKPHWWTVGKRRTRIRLKIATSGAAGTFVLRSLELLVRPTGRQ